jgi:CubicO group peptidase (beta-lactamase class C family)
MLEPGEPPRRDRHVTAANWLAPPGNRWAVWHVRELAPTQAVSRGQGPVAPLRPRSDPPDVGAIPVARVGGSTGTVAQVLGDTFTDAFLVVQDGDLVAESYATGGGPDQVHAVMSVSKSLVGCVAGALADRGALDVEALVTRYVPELGRSGYAGAAVRDVLDMRSGVRFDEDYTSPRGDLRRMDRWVLARGRLHDAGLYPFLRTLPAERPHGGPFRYRSCETDVLGWVCERAGDARMADLVSELIWSRIGAEHDGGWTCDRHGTALHDGGFSATARDLARFGRLLLDGGALPDEGGARTQVLPASWLRGAWRPDAGLRQAFRDSPAEAGFPGGWYRNQLWFRPGAVGDVLLCLGIHGQLLYVCPRTGTVCVKLSSWPEAQHPAFLQDTVQACDAIAGALSGRAAPGAGVTGVVSGLSRRGSRPRGRGGPVV